MTSVTGSDDFDVDFVPPPAELWARVADALVAALAEPDNAPLVVEYRINGDDVVVEVGGSWVEFAGSNDAPELADDGIGRTLWSSMTPGDLTDLWKAAVLRVRERGEATSVPFRCDGPGARRWFSMTITPENDGHLRFRSELSYEMARPAVAALHRARGVDADEVVEVCSWCGEGRDGDAWHPIEEVLAPRRLLEGTPSVRVDFGLCPRCRVDATCGLIADTGTDTGTDTDA